MVESAFVLPVALSLIMGTIIAGLGVFRYHQLAYLAREGSRWASVRGPTYQTDQNASPATASDVMAGAVTPQMAGLSPSLLTSTLTWNTAASPPTVTFKLTYSWVPEAILPSTTFTSTSTQIITY